MKNLKTFESFILNEESIDDKIYKNREKLYALQDRLFDLSRNRLANPSSEKEKLALRTQLKKDIGKMMRKLEDLGDYEHRSDT